jgi:uncharacterized protein (DUF433 family)
MGNELTGDQLMEFVTDGDTLVAETVRKSVSETAEIDNLGLPVWLIIDCARTVGFDSEQIAARYGLTEESVEMAFRYYETHKPLIDAQISTCLESYS